MPQPPNVNVNINVPGLPSLPGLPGVPSLPGAGGIRPPAVGPAAGGGGGIRLNRATNGSGAVASLPNRPDPVGELRFKVDLPGVDLGRFRECTGLAAEIEVKDYNEGGVNDRVHKLPTRMKYPNLVLKRGVTYEDALLKWLYKTQKEAQRIAVTVSLMGPDGKKVRSWSFQDAFPIKWQGPNLNAGSNQVATETLEIVHGGLQMQAGA